MNEIKEGKYKKYYVQDLQYPQNMSSPEFNAMYQKFAKRVLWIDGNIVPGAVQMNTAWYFGVPEKDPVFPGHVHPDDELIGFFSSDPNDPYNLDAEIEVAIDGEKQLLTRSTLIFIPGGVPHMPLRVIRVGRPVFHFSIVIGKDYDGGAYK